MVFANYSKRINDSGVKEYNVTLTQAKTKLNIIYYFQQ